MGYDTIILGGGPAGLAAALYAKRAGIVPLLLEKAVWGGQMVNTPAVENYPGIVTISGAELAMAMHRQVSGLGVEIRLEAPTRCELTAEVKTVVTAQGVYEAPTVIIANGAKRRALGCPGEERFSGRGVSYCATCDGAFFRGREAAVIGGGNTALEDALFLANHCSAVHLIHRREEFRGSPVLVEAAEKRENIVIRRGFVVDEITGDKTVSGIVLRSVATGETQTLPLAGVFIAVGLAPDNSLFSGQLELDEAGYIRAGEDCRTSLPGVFAAGDTRTKQVRQIVTAAADGAVAALGAAGSVSRKK